MAVNVATLIAKLKMDTRHLERGTRRANKSLGKMRGGTVAVSKGLRAMGPAALFGTAAAGAAVGVFVTSSIKAFASFDKGMKEVFTLLPDITGEAMDKMTQQAKDLAAEMGILPDKVIPALYQAISAGVPKENVFDFMEIASKAAIGGVTTLEVAVDGLTSVVNAFGKENITTTKAADLMFTAVRLGKTTFEELSRFMFQVNPIAAGLGVEFSNVTAALAALTAQGVPTRVAATQIRQALVELGKGGTIASDAFKKLTGESFVDFIAKGGDVKQAFDIMKTGADDLGVGVGDLFGSVEASMAVIALTTKDGAAAFGNAMSEMQDSAGATEAAFDRMDEGLARSMEKLKAESALLRIELGEKLAPAMLAVVEASLAGVKAMDDWFLGAGLVAQGTEKLGSRVLDFINLGFTDFWDDADEALFQFTKTAGHANAMLAEGADAANVAADWMAHLATKTALTERTWEAMRLTTGLTAAEMDKAARFVIENADAWGLNADQVNRLSTFLGFFRDGMPGVIGKLEDYALRAHAAAAGTDVMALALDNYGASAGEIAGPLAEATTAVAGLMSAVASTDGAIRASLDADIFGLYAAASKSLFGVPSALQTAIDAAKGRARQRAPGGRVLEGIDFHSGGVVPGPRGKEVAATLLGGETVIPIGGAGGVTIGELHVTLQGTFDQSDPSAARRFAVQMREELDTLNAEVA